MHAIKSLPPKLRIIVNNIRYMHKYIYNMNKAYLRHSSDGNKFDLSFQFTHPHYKVDRNFNFSRKLDETVSSFLSRVTTNLEKVITKANKKRQPEPLAAPISVSLHVNQVKIANEEVCKQVFQPENQITLKLIDQEYEVLINAPFVETVSLPTSMLANFPTYPIKFESIFVDKHQSEFTWFKSVDKTNWEKIGNEYMITPDNSTIGFYLKLVCTPKNNLLVGPQIEVISDNPVAPSPGACPFEIRNKFTEERCKNDEFRVVTYNILADLYCDSDYTRTVLHPYCPPYALHIDYRKQLFIKEILGYNSDIICLQEVDKKVFLTDFEPLMQQLNYGCSFSIKGGQVAEGIVCFHNKDKFRLISEEKVLLNELIQSPGYESFWTAIAGNEQLKTRYLDRQTVSQFIVLECNFTKNLVIVANTHLYFHPDADHIRLIQGGSSIKYVENLHGNLKKQNPDKKISVIFCGDFNSTPDSGIYKLFTSGNVDSNLKDWQSNKEEVINDLSISQPFALNSACGTPKYTNYTVGYADCLDYIYYDTATVDVQRFVPMPTNDELILHTALPSVVFPSDHISLCADLKWKT